MKIRYLSGWSGVKGHRGQACQGARRGTSVPAATFGSVGVSFAPVEWSGEAADASTPFEHAYPEHPTGTAGRAVSATTPGIARLRWHR
jgi:hypothetical protein